MQQQITINYLILAINNKNNYNVLILTIKSPMQITNMFQLTNIALNKQQLFNNNNKPNPITISHALYNKYRYRYKQQQSLQICIKNNKHLYENQHELQRKQLNSFQQYSVQHDNQISTIDKIIQQSLTSAYIQYRDACYYSQNQQFMKRQYYDTEYKTKIQNLSQYYKFHRNLPVWNNKSVSSIMERYYNKIKDIDYKIVKSILKKQQGISLTTRKSFSSFDQSQYSVYSRYSNMLESLQNSNDSLMLRDFCDKIDVALKKVKIQKNFKGTYYSGQNKFQEFLRKQQRRKQNNCNKNFHKQMKNSQKKNQQLKNSFGLQTVKFTKNQIQNHSQSKRQLHKQKIFSSTQLIKQNNCLPPKPKKIQKYLQNQKIYDRNTLRQKNNSLHKTKQKIENVDTMLQKNQQQNTKSRQKTKSKTKTKVQQNIKNQIINSKFGSVKRFNIAQIVLNQSIQPKKQNKVLSKSKSTTKLTQRSRSNSTYNLQYKPTSFIKQTNKKQLISSIKTNRSSSINKSNSNSRSKFSSNLHMPLPRTVAKGTVIELTQLTNLNKINSKNDKSLALTSRENSMKRLRSNSNSNSNSNLNTKMSTKFFMNHINKSTNSTNQVQNHTKSQSQCQTKVFKQNKSGLHAHSRTKTSTTNLNFNLQPNAKDSQNILIDLNLNQLANVKKLSTSTTKNKTAIKNPNQKLFAKKRNSAVETMVEKKLISIKRKLAVN